MQLYSIRFMAGRKTVEWIRFADNRQHLIDTTMKAAVQEYPTAEIFKVLEIKEQETPNA